ncbi:MAG: hypothetical protein AAF558_09530 [Verrucomicrobiota bacterium]
MRIIVTGLIGQYPFGGVIWDYIQYVTGFRKLGYDVLYLEDTGVWPYDPIKETVTDDCSYQVSALKNIMDSFDLGDRWVYRNAADNTFHGAGESIAREWLKSADLLVNVSTASWLEDYDIGVKHQMFIDGDPLFTQIGLLDGNNSSYAERLRAHDSHFSFGLNLGNPGCQVPKTGIQWRPTLQPVDLDYWTFEDQPGSNEFTTVMNWVSYPPKEWDGKSFGQKDVEFLRFIELPQKTPQSFTIAMGQGIGKTRPTKHIQDCGWSIVEPDQVLPDHKTYHEFLSRSRAEWSIAKEAYVKADTGWFSCRTACYLAAGRPGLVQDTGWTKHLPHGDGLLSFNTLSECLDGIESINRDYDQHRRAARKFAETYLDATKVCHDLIEQAQV